MLWRRARTGTVIFTTGLRLPHGPDTDTRRRARTARPAELRTCCSRRRRESDGTPTADIRHSGSPVLGGTVRHRRERGTHLPTARDGRLERRTARSVVWWAGYGARAGRQAAAGPPSISRLPNAAAAVRVRGGLGPQHPRPGRPGHPDTRPGARSRYLTLLVVQASGRRPRIRGNKPARRVVRPRRAGGQDVSSATRDRSGEGRRTTAAAAAVAQNRARSRKVWLRAMTWVIQPMTAGPASMPM